MGRKADELRETITRQDAQLLDARHRERQQSDREIAELRSRVNMHDKQMLAMQNYLIAQEKRIQELIDDMPPPAPLVVVNTRNELNEVRQWFNSLGRPGVKAQTTEEEVSANGEGTTTS